MFQPWATSVKIFHWIRLERRSNYTRWTHDSPSSSGLLFQPRSSASFWVQLLSGYRRRRAFAKSASLRPDAHDPPLIRLVVEATRGSVKANTSSYLFKILPFLSASFLTFLFLLSSSCPRFFSRCSPFSFFLLFFSLLFGNSTSPFDGCWSFPFLSARLRVASLSFSRGKNICQTCKLAFISFEVPRRGNRGLIAIWSYDQSIKSSFVHIFLYFLCY